MNTQLLPISSTRLHPVYQALLNELTSEIGDLEKKILLALRQVMPQGLTRRELVYIIFDVQIAEDENISNSTLDRKIRKAIEDMRDRLIPIVSTSGSAGYRLDISEEAINEMIADWTSRRDTYNERIRRGEQLKLKVRQAGEDAIPEELSKEPVQIGLGL